MREVVLDTETTGLNPLSGDRIVEIGCVELVNHVATGKVYHQYVNPERDMPDEAFAVHGLSQEFLGTHPVFADIVDKFLDFIGEDILIIHNAPFDLGFLNAELARAERPPLPMDRATDTVTMARRKFPGAQASLDALCRRFQIDNTGRVKHGALLDSELLAEVYLELVGGRQPDLQLASGGGAAQTTDPDGPAPDIRAARPHTPTMDEVAAHAEFMDRLKNPIWLEKA